ncbi:MAG: hypothetical protein ACPG4N_00025 [Gammaproteobacteria bacterium]
MPVSLSRSNQSIGHELLAVPMGDMIRQMAFAIADAQQELDESSMRVAEMMSGRKVLRDEEGNLIDIDGNLLPADSAPVTEPVHVHFDGEEISMMELGFSPTFYQFVDTLIEVKIAIKITRETSRDSKKQGEITKKTKKRSGLFGIGSRKTTVTTTPVDASYSSKYSYSAEGSSLLRTKLVPVPPPPVLEERVRALMEADIAEREAAALAAAEAESESESETESETE